MGPKGQMWSQGPHHRLLAIVAISAFTRKNFLRVAKNLVGIMSTTPSSKNFFLNPNGKTYAPSWQWVYNCVGLNIVRHHFFAKLPVLQ